MAPGEQTEADGQKNACDQGDTENSSRARAGIGMGRHQDPPAGDRDEKADDRGDDEKLHHPRCGVECGEDDGRRLDYDPGRYRVAGGNPIQFARADFLEQLRHAPTVSRLPIGAMGGMRGEEAEIRGSGGQGVGLAWAEGCCSDSLGLGASRVRCLDESDCAARLERESSVD